MTSVSSSRVDAVLQRKLQVERQLVGSVEGDQRRHRDQAAVMRRQAGPLPDVSEQDVVGVGRQPRSDVGEWTAVLGCLVRHGDLLVRGSVRGKAAVDREGDADDEAGSRAAQPEHGRGDLLGGPGGRSAGRAGPRIASSSPFARMSATIGVSIVPGQTALMRMPRGAYSSAALLVRPSTPCLVAW